jgi:ADP-ribose pyrophosphatase
VKKVKVYKNSRFELHSAPESDSIFIHEYQPEYSTVVALVDGRLVMVKQYREGIGQDTYELPGGAMVKGETPEDAARRELAEETGYICGELIYLGKVHAYASMIDRQIHMFFTKDISEQRDQNLDFDEDIEIQTYEVEEAFAQIRDNHWPDAETAQGLLLARLKGLL